MTYDPTTDFGPGEDRLYPAATASGLLQELQLHAYRPFQDEPDPRPLPDAEHVAAALSAAVENLTSTMTDTRLEDDLGDILWRFVNIFHRKITSIEHLLDDNESDQRRCQRLQDGSEIRSVELERLTALGLSLIERRNAFEAFRDLAADHYRVVTGSTWRPRSGSLARRQTLTAAVIDSRDYIAAKRKADIEPLLPVGPRIAFTGGTDYNDHARIWAALDKARAKHPDMVLIHGGSPKGAEKIASLWADNRNIHQIIFKPDWTRHRNAAPFKRNDQVLDATPIGVIAFPGSGISQNLADKARKIGIKVWLRRPE